MEPIAIVKKRSHIWAIMIAIVIAILFVAAALWFMGDTATTDISQGRRPGILQAVWPSTAV